MIKLPVALQNAINHFSNLPGVGAKTAMRQVLDMANWSAEDLQKFGHAISSLGEIKECNECHIYCETEICEICSNPTRKEMKTLCVVENVTDAMAIEKSEQFKGLYHILGGVLNPLMGVGPDEIHLTSLLERVKQLEIETLILALNPSVEGDATCAFINQEVDEKIAVERIGFGMPMGGSLEYLDPLTITKALENRKRI